MGRDPAARKRALERMLQAERAMQSARREQNAWTEWQRAATDYWVFLHPELDRLRRGRLSGRPTIADMRERADALGQAMRGVPKDWRLRKDSPERHEHQARVGWFHEIGASLYEPVLRAGEQVRAGDRSGTETLLRYLEADVYCFRSGYLKAEVIRDLCRAELDEAETARLRAVLFAVIDGYDRREFRAYCRIARRLDTPELRDELRALVAAGKPVTARHARWVIDSLSGRGHPMAPGPETPGCIVS